MEGNIGEPIVIGPEWLAQILKTEHRASASIAGFHRLDQLRRDDTLKQMRSATGPGGSGSLTAARQASWICCFHARDSMEPVTRTDNCGGPGEAAVWLAGASAIAEVGP